jgi:hypothetical protein
VAADAAHHLVPSLTTDFPRSELNKIHLLLHNSFLL